MSSLLIYLILVIGIQLILLTAYQWISKPEHFRLNRWILLVFILVSFGLPFLGNQINFDLYPPQEQSNTLEESIMLEEVNILIHSKLPSYTQEVSGNAYLTTTGFIWILYGLGCCITLFLFCRKLNHIFQLKRNAVQLKLNGTIYYEMQDSNEAFNFFQWIFLGDQIQPQEKELIFQHENQHRIKGHSYDLLCLEILKVAFWFNPLWYWFQKELREVHELQADEAIETSKSKSYAQILLQHAFTPQSKSFVNSFNKSVIKTRIMVLQKKKNRKIGMKYLLFIPLLILLISLSGFTSMESTTQDHPKLISYVEQLKAYQQKGEVKKIELYAENLKNNNRSQLTEDEFYQRSAWFVFQDEIKKNEAVENPIDWRAIKYQDYKKFQQENDTVAFANLSDVPVFPGCEDLSTNDEKKTCMQQKIMEHVNSNFNITEARKYAIPGKNRIYVSFLIDQNGKVTYVRGRAESEELKEEGIKVVESLPTMQPGKSEGKPVIVSYNLPIVFEIPKEKGNKEN
ncbi:MAG: M56 family metallopeptidase [Flavobacteriaceae bacterium]|nr:M56 family metallopeptidase [Flavobacteriaceae bacterium]